MANYNTWPRDMYTGPGGGMYTGPGGGLYTGPGGGMYTGPSLSGYRNNQPPKHILLEELRKRGYTAYYETLKRYLKQYPF